MRWRGGKEGWRGGGEEGWRGGGEKGRRGGGEKGSATGVREPRPHEGGGPNGSSSAWSQTHLWQLHDDVGGGLSDEGGLHLPPLLLDRFSCSQTTNTPDEHASSRAVADDAIVCFP